MSHSDQCDRIFFLFFLLETQKSLSIDVNCECFTGLFSCSYFLLMLVIV